MWILHRHSYSIFNMAAMDFFPYPCFNQLLPVFAIAIKGVTDPVMAKLLVRL